MRVALNSLAIDKIVALGSVGFCGGRKIGEPREKPSEQGREPTTNLGFPIELELKNVGFNRGRNRRTRGSPFEKGRGGQQRTQATNEPGSEN